jgi:pyrroline-5-carboxylate reductase
MRLGFIGTGVITAHIVRGLKGSELADWQVILSPRNEAIAVELAGLPGVSVAADNQAVIDGADAVVLAVRPQVAAEVIRPLRFDPARPVISLIAATSLEDLGTWTGAREICRAIPLPSVEARTCVTPVFPPNPLAMQVFDALGQALAVQDLSAFDAYATGSAVMATWFGMAETAAGWMVDNGIPPADAETYMRGLFADLGVTVRDKTRSLETLRHDHATKGGLNEQIWRVFGEKDGPQALQAGMSSVMARISGPK